MTSSRLDTAIPPTLCQSLSYSVPTLSSGTAHTIVHHYNSTQHCSTETVLLIFTFLETITSHRWRSEGKGVKQQRTAVHTVRCGTPVQLADVDCSSRHLQWCTTSSRWQKVTASLACCQNRDRPLKIAVLRQYMPQSLW